MPGVKSLKTKEASFSSTAWMDGFEIAIPTATIRFRQKAEVLSFFSTGAIIKPSDTYKYRLK